MGGDKKPLDVVRNLLDIGNRALIGDLLDEFRGKVDGGWMSMTSPSSLRKIFK